MTRADIILMAQEANRYANNQTGDSYEWHFIRDERFAALVAAAERERNAQIADAHASCEGIAQVIAAEIRGQA